MKLSYKIEYDFFKEVKVSYYIECSNIAFYRYWKTYLPEGQYNNRSVGLYFSKMFQQIFSCPSGIKIEYRR